MSMYTYLTAEDLERLTKDAAIASMEKVVHSEEDIPFATKVSVLKGVLMMMHTLREDIVKEVAAEDAREAAEKKGETTDENHA